MNNFKRKKQTIKKADAILCADLHIRHDVPRCRTDDFIEAQFRKLNFIFDLCKENNCPLLVAGDFGHKSQWPNKLLERFMSLVAKYDIDIITILGQHDLPNHRIDSWHESGCGVLHSGFTIFVIEESQNINDKFILNPFSYGIKVCNAKRNILPQIAITHQMIIENKPLWKDQKAPKGHELLKGFPKYNLILSGDNHLPFVSKYKNRLLVNPGSMMRTTADQINYKPKVYKWFIDTNIVEDVYLPIEQNVINRDHIDNKQEKDIRMATYMQSLSNSIETKMCFRTNIKKYININNVDKAIEEIINKSMA